MQYSSVDFNFQFYFKISELVSNVSERKKDNDMCRPIPFSRTISMEKNLSFIINSNEASFLTEVYGEWETKMNDSLKIRIQ